MNRTSTSALGATAAEGDRRKESGSRNGFRDWAGLYLGLTVDEVVHRYGIQTIDQILGNARCQRTELNNDATISGRIGQAQEGEASGWRRMVRVCVDATGRREQPPIRVRWRPIGGWLSGFAISRRTTLFDQRL